MLSVQPSPIHGHGVFTDTELWPGAVIESPSRTLGTKFHGFNHSFNHSCIHNSLLLKSGLLLVISHIPALSEVTLGYPQNMFFRGPMWKTEQLCNCPKCLGKSETVLKIGPAKKISASPRPQGVK